MKTSTQRHAIRATSDVTATRGVYSRIAAEGVESECGRVEWSRAELSRGELLREFSRKRFDVRLLKY